MFFFSFIAVGNKHGRTPLRKKLADFKKRSSGLIKLINEKAGKEIVTEENRMSGIFPWQNDGQSN